MTLSKRLPGEMAENECRETVSAKSLKPQSSFKFKVHLPGEYMELMLAIDLGCTNTNMNKTKCVCHGVRAEGTNHHARGRRKWFRREPTLLLTNEGMFSMRAVKQPL